MPLATYLALRDEPGRGPRAQPGADRRVVRRARRAARPLARRFRRDRHWHERCGVDARRAARPARPGRRAGRSRPARCSPSSGRTAPASRPCCASSPGCVADRPWPHRWSTTTCSTTRRANVFVPPERRPIGVVFQDYLLFAHLSALENVAFGLRARGVPAHDGAAPRRRVARAGRAGRPRHRTGRLVCPAARRSASPSPGRWPPTRALLLLDEPLAALDAGTRTGVRRDLRRPPRVVRRDAHHRHPRPGRRLRARRPRGHHRSRRGRPARHDRRRDRPPALALRRRPGRHQPRGRRRRPTACWSPPPVRTSSSPTPRRAGRSP